MRRLHEVTPTYVVTKMRGAPTIFLGIVSAYISFIPSSANSASILSIFSASASVGRSVEDASTVIKSVPGLISNDPSAKAESINNIVCIAGATECTVADAVHKVAKPAGDSYTASHQLDQAVEDGDYAKIKDILAQKDGREGYVSEVERNRLSLSTPLASHDDQLITDSNDYAYVAMKVSGAIEWFANESEKITKFGRGINIDFGYLLGSDDSPQESMRNRTVGLPESEKKRLEEEEAAAERKREEAAREQLQRQQPPQPSGETDFCSIPYSVYASRFPYGQAPARYECPNG